MNDTTADAAQVTPTDTQWYKDAVIYQVHVKSYFDANNDGIGDFPGLVEKLDYIAQLGVNTIWLLPFYPSPRRDDGYDIADYQGVHDDYGTMDDARNFIQEAHRRGLRVITELVINHTSDQHPWFQSARQAAPGSPERDFYVWSDNDRAYDGTRIIFCDTEKSNWTWDPVANAFFWHRFYSHQPDLNFDNPAVLDAVLKVMGYWLEIGVDGLRLDAVPYLIEREGTSNENLPETHVILKKIRAEMDKSYAGRLLLAEANMWPEDVQQYFGDNDECHMAFHFPLMPRMYMALAQEDRFPITDILRQTPAIPADCQWAIFLRNHDELTLEMVTDKERDYLWNYYASDRRARINMGIRRRLAPLLERDRRRSELLNSFLLSMPGTPVLYYGDEIGMGDNIHLGDRDGVRTPMQWTSDRNGGFSRANPASLVLPPIMDALYGYQAVNVEAQTADPYSQLNWMRRMLAVRSKHAAFGRGTLKILYPANRKILAYLREYDDGSGSGPETILCVANVSQAAQAVELELSDFIGRVPVEMLGGAAFPPIGQLNYLLTLPPYGFYWFSLAAQARMPSWHMPSPEPLPEYTTLVIRHSVAEIMNSPIRERLEKDVLPAYLPKRRWYADKGETLHSARIALTLELPPSPSRASILPVLLTEIETVTAKGTHRYTLPMGYFREVDLAAALPQQLALARVRRGPRVGYLTDAFSLDAFAWSVLELLHAGTVLPCEDGEVRFIPTKNLADVELGATPEIRRLSAEQSNSSLVMADLAVLKVIRLCQGGVHPEAEMGRYLTERGYANTPPMLGEVVRMSANGIPHALIIVQRFIHNQGDAWQWTLDTLGRARQQAIVQVNVQAGVQAVAIVGGTAAGVPGPSEIIDPMSELLTFAETLGRRLGELHAVLALPTDNPDFQPRQAGDTDIAAWTAGACTQVDAALRILQTTSDWSSPAEAALASRLIAAREPLLARVGELAAAGLGTLCTRIHGDFHLGQILVSQGDVYLVDFEGEPAKPIDARREKASPLRDVAGLLRSFDYAAAFAIRSGSTDVGQDAATRCGELMDRFVPRASAAFLGAYHAAIGATITGTTAASTGQPSDLLQFFIIEKAAYEICYEAANRPTWIGVPLQGLASIVEALLSPGSNPNE
ncbi:MAG: maltose alpha-D-glucosyltransferase [Pseudomonadota bacterium]